jgi:hypothetical protein
MSPTKSSKTVAPRRATRGAEKTNERLDERAARERIARVAYQRFLERGASHGHDLEDWLAAERELRGGG